MVGRLGWLLSLWAAWLAQLGEGDKVTAELKLNVEIIEVKCEMESVTGMKSSLAF